VGILEAIESAKNVAVQYGCNTLVTTRSGVDYRVHLSDEMLTQYDFEVAIVTPEGEFFSPPIDKHYPKILVKEDLFETLDT
jgi:hypothetical protein